MSDLELRMEKLEQRVHELQDRVDLHEIMARYGPAVDSGSADAAAALWAEDGIYDAEGAGPMRSADAVREMFNGPAHQSLLPNCAHTIGPATLDLDGDRATATGYSRVYKRKGDAFELWRLATNRWEFERRDGRWCVARRVNRLIGNEESRQLLARAVE